MTDNGTPMAVCAVTLVMAPGGHGVGIHPHQPDGQTERAPTHSDLTAMAAILAQWCQVRAMLSEIESQRKAGPQIVPFHGPFPG